MRPDVSIGRLRMTAAYALRQLAGGFSGRAFPIARMHWAAWYESSEKRLPTEELSRIFPGIYDHRVELRHAIPREPRTVLVEELHMLALMCRHLMPRVIFEFGTFNGRTTLNLALNTPPDAVIHSLDLPPKTAVALTEDPRDTALHLGERTAVVVGECTKIRRLGDPAVFDESGFQDSVDFIFIDGGHSYDEVCNDSENALRMLKPGGVIVWHDYSAWFPDVARYLHELARREPLRHIAGTQLVILVRP